MPATPPVSTPPFQRGPLSRQAPLSHFWTIQDSSGRLLAEYLAASQLDVAYKVAPGHYDRFRLEVSSSYRKLFERALGLVLARHAWQIVQVSARRAKQCRSAQAAADPSAPHL
ncbi:MAG: hypothetical protein HY053_03245 [Proteobacteria bacterium]|nr:hypothetical protein [Pseudomonadota bacterium]